MPTIPLSYDTFTLPSFASLQSNQLNQMIKTLTLASIILMACTLIAGVYGMNFVVSFIATGA